MPNFTLDLVSYRSITGNIHHLMNDNANVVVFACLTFVLLDTRVVCSFEKLCMTQLAAINSFARVLKLEKN